MHTDLLRKMKGKVKELKNQARTKNRERRKRGQVKMIETILVLLALVFFFGIIIIFYSRFQLFEVQKLAREVDEERASSLLGKISGMPELKCSVSFGSASGADCIDTYKLLALSKQQSKFEEEFEGLSEVRVERVYPPPSGAGAGQACDFGNNYPENCTYWQLYKKAGTGSRTSLDSFVTLCTQRTSVLYECEIGRIIVGVPDKGAKASGGGGA